VASVSVYRFPDVSMDRNRLYRVFIDGADAGECWPGQTVSFSVRPGSHTVRVKIDFMGSNEVNVNLGEFEVAELACSGRGSAAAMFRTIFRRNEYLDLHPMSPDERSSREDAAERSKPPAPRNLGRPSDDVS
jgi:hypothetical protein